MDTVIQRQQLCIVCVVVVDCWWILADTDIYFLVRNLRDYYHLE